ncbi:L-type lectin-domain containing receptor kinase S.4-like [Quercus robur]|uniref:L-type lectin-domain containing receptor kinase S.4-like n=1 Tax=Quercus robur TaxID=38942 RepID=UPI00216262DB|nr:L-type lectin-domain containing receptor kinase S.4-like [Quercus robur]
MKAVAEKSWEPNTGWHSFTYDELHKATKGFGKEMLLGSGGFGQVYLGKLPNSNVQVAVKKLSKGSEQGSPEFELEVSTLSSLRHRNVVQLLGYCKENGDLLIVYEYMKHGSLDKHLFKEDQTILSWEKRFKIIKGVASGLLYLHEELEQVIIHRDIKPGNILLDSEFQGKLGDFGLAMQYKRSSDEGILIPTLGIVGTPGYWAPESVSQRIYSAFSDVYAYGVLLIVVLCGKKPNWQALLEELTLVDWVKDKCKEGLNLDVMDPNLKGEFDHRQARLVLKLGLRCLKDDPKTRPTMREVTRVLDDGLFGTQSAVW